MVKIGHLPLKGHLTFQQEKGEIAFNANKVWPSTITNKLGLPFSKILRLPSLKKLR
jgi:hypothetical protein